jgi:hypothetical protein
VVAAVLVLTGTAAGVSLALTHRSHGHGGDKAATAPPSSAEAPTAQPPAPGPSPSGTGSPGSPVAGSPGTDTTPVTTPADTPSPSATQVPAGFTRTQDSAGFTLDIPTGWTRSADGVSVFYNQPGGIGLIQVYPVAVPEQTPYEALSATSQSLTSKTGFHLLSLKRLGAADDAPAELQYTYRGTAGDERHVVDRAFTGPDGVQYSVLARAASQAWPSQLAWLDTAVRSFCPTSACTTP